MVNNIPVNGWPQLKDLEAVQPTLDRLDKIEAWKRTVKEETFTGDDITIENALALPARSLITFINAIQDLHGLPFPYVGGAYKNKLPMTVDRIKAANTAGSWSGNVYTINGGTFTILTDNADNVTGIKINGTFSEQPIFRLGYMDFYANTEYTLNGAVPNTSNFRLSISTKGSDYGDGYTYIPTADDLQRTVIVYCDNNPTANNLVFKPMIRTSGDATFAPYSNICPISGRTESTVTVSDGDEISEDFTIQLGQTVYGADINWDTGAMTVTHVIVDMGDMEWTYSSANTRFQANMPSDYKIPASSSERITGLLCSCYEPNISPITGSHIDGTISGYEGSVTIYVNDYTMTDAAAFKTARTGQKILYRLATPTTIQLTPTEVQMLKGYNRVTLSDGYGTIELKALTGANWS